MKGFVVLPRRWVVERTFSWFGRNRRRAKDYGNLAATLATFVTLATIQLGIRRLARAWAFESGAYAVKNRHICCHHIEQVPPNLTHENRFPDTAPI